MNTLNILLGGVGGQGVILASKILSRAALLEGLDIKQSEVHGMSQRGGSVVSHVRIGDVVRSPLVPLGQCDILLGFEPLEALRYAHWVKAEGVVIYSTARINPATVSSGLAEYPSDIARRLGEFPCRKVAVDADRLADEAGNRRAANVVLVGALSRSMSFSRELWDRALAESVPAKALDLNRKAFALGASQGG